MADEKKNIANKATGGLFWTFMERFCAEAVSFVVSIILARLLLPDDYGAVAMVQVFISLANTFVSSGLGTSLVQKKNADNIDFSSAFYFNIAFSLCLYSILFIIAPFVANFYDMPVLRPVLRVLGIRIILASINSIQQAYVAKHMMFKKFFWATFIGTAGAALIGILLAYGGFGVWALVAQYLFNATVDTIVLWFTVKWRPDFVFQWNRLKRLINFGWKVLANSLVITLYDNLRSLIIGKKYSSSDLGFYTKGTSFPKLIVNNINTAVGKVLLPTLSLLQDDYISFKQAMRRAIRTSSFIMLPLMMGLFTIAPHIVSLLLTDKWLPCVPYLRIACIYFAFFPITTVDNQALNAVGKSGIALKLTFVKRGIGIVLILISMNIGIWALAFTDVIVTLLALIIGGYSNRIFFKYNIKEQLLDLGTSFFGAIIMSVGIGVVDHFICQIISSNVIIIISDVIVGGVIYCVCSFTFNRDDTMYVWKRLRNFRRVIS